MSRGNLIFTLRRHGARAWRCEEAVELKGVSWVCGKRVGKGAWEVVGGEGNRGWEKLGGAARGKGGGNIPVPVGR